VKPVTVDAASVNSSPENSTLVPKGKFYRQTIILKEFKAMAQGV